MPSQPFDTGWDFSSVLDLIDSDLHDIGSPTLLPQTRTAPHSSHASENIDYKLSGDNHVVSLGGFKKLWDELGVRDDALPAISPLEPESEDHTESDIAPLPPADNGNAADAVDTRDANSDRPLYKRLPKYQEKPTEDPLAGMTKKQRSQARKRAVKERKANAILEQQCEQREVMREDLQARLDLSPQGPPKRIHHVAPISKQVRGQPRSNVGAKIRSSTPNQVDSPTPVREMPSTPTLPSGHTLSDSTPHPLGGDTTRPTVSSAQVPGFSRVVHPLPPQPRGIASANPELAESDAAVKTQCNTVGTHISHQNQFPFPQSNGAGFVYPSVSTPAGFGLVPRTVKPVVVPQMRQPPITPSVQPMGTPGTTQPPITPGRHPRTVTIRPRTDRHIHFLNQLLLNFPEDKKWLVSPMQLCNESSSAEGIHVFVDASNIMIGFKYMLGQTRTHGYEMSFDSLALLMERRRPVAKRVFAGSHRESAPLPHVTKLVETSKAVGYENNVKEQVLIRREESEKKKFFKDVQKMGWVKAAQRHSGSGSDPEMETAPATPSAPKWVEQGVDEILHLKMCQSIIDTETPTTMVLATGDGAEAEYSDGFLAHVERALKKGWKVELVTWKQQTNGGYKNKKFRAKWGDRFTIIELDWHLESLIDTP